jgi:pimeloyl-ACP methyl ester carboxylesterase
MRITKRLLAGVLALAAVAGSLPGCAYLDVKQRELIFRPNKAYSSTPAEYGLAFEDVWLAVQQAGAPDAAERVHGWWMPASDPKAPALLYLHGARWSIGNNLFRIARLREAGFSVLAIDYRGFGKSDGELPSEAQTYEDAHTAWTWLEAKVPDARRRFIMGHSLGGAVAIELAARHPAAAGLIVEASFTSIPDMASRSYWYVPSVVLTQRYDSRQKIASVKLPVLFMHGKADGVVPYQMSEQLHAAATSHKRLVLMDEAGHSNMSWKFSDAYLAALRAFVAEVAGAAGAARGAGTLSRHP